MDPSSSRLHDEHPNNQAYLDPQLANSILVLADALGGNPHLTNAVITHSDALGVNPELTSAIIAHADAFDLDRTAINNSANCNGIDEYAHELQDIECGLDALAERIDAHPAGDEYCDLDADRQDPSINLAQNTRTTAPYHINNLEQALQDFPYDWAADNEFNERNPLNVPLVIPLDTSNPFLLPINEEINGVLEASNAEQDLNMSALFDANHFAPANYQIAPYENYFDNPRQEERQWFDVSTIRPRRHYEPNLMENQDQEHAIDEINDQYFNNDQQGNGDNYDQQENLSHNERIAIDNEQGNANNKGILGIHLQGDNQSHEDQQENASIIIEIPLDLDNDDLENQDAIKKESKASRTEKCVDDMIRELNINLINNQAPGNDALILTNPQVGDHFNGGASLENSFYPWHLLDEAILEGSVPYAVHPAWPQLNEEEQIMHTDISIDDFDFAQLPIEEQVGIRPPPQRRLGDAEAQMEPFEVLLPLMPPHMEKNPLPPPIPHQPFLPSLHRQGAPPRLPTKEDMVDNPITHVPLPPANHPREENIDPSAPANDRRRKVNDPAAEPRSPRRLRDRTRGHRAAQEEMEENHMDPAPAAQPPAPAAPPARKRGRRAPADSRPPAAPRTLRPRP